MTDATSNARNTLLAGRFGSYRSLVLAFLAGTFTWTYGYDLLVRSVLGAEIPFLAPIPRAWGPLLATLVVLFFAHGSVREWARQVTQWRISVKWWLFALLFPVTFSDVSVLPELLGGASLEALPMPLWQYLAFFLVMAIAAGGLEEFGWRGFLQPLFQRRTSALVAAVVVGLLWVAWHLPLFFLFEGLDYQVSNLHVYTGFLIGQSILLAWMYNRTGGSVLPCVVFHAAGNLPALVTTSGEVGGALGIVSEYVGLAVLWLGVVIVVTVEGHQYLTDRPVEIAGLELAHSSS